MPTLTIDGRTITVENGLTVIEAAERLGIMIPRFCWHEALGAAGACRMCAVMFEDGPVKGLQMSCTVAAADGMVVSTDHPEAMAFRAQVAEWLMMNHPHDCPICDEGGQCHLQDTTISAGHSLRRYQGPKRTYPDQDLGPLVTHEMNRCIHCYRCVRFYQEYCGYRDFGVMKNASQVFYGRYKSGRLESPFAGNLTGVCPTGVYTDKPSRHKGRRWDMQRAPSVCMHCSLGCNLTANARYREIIRLEARKNAAVNGHFICDRGRHGFGAANLASRPRAPMTDGAQVSLAEAVKTAVLRLQNVTAKHGPGSAAILSSPRANLETLAALKLLAAETGFRAPEYFGSPVEIAKAAAAARGVCAETAVSMGGLAKADMILVLGADPVNEAPMLALALRQAARNGAAVAVIDPRPVSLPCDFERVAVSRRHLEACLAALVGKSLEGASLAGADMAAYAATLAKTPVPASPEGLADRLDALAQKLKTAAFPVVVCGFDLPGESAPGFAAACARLLKASRGESGRAGFFPLFPGPNAMGAAMALMDQRDARSDPEPGDARGVLGLVEAMERGEIRALLAVEADPFALFPDHERLRKALANLDVLVVCDWLPSFAAGAARVVLPCRNAFETDGHYVNGEGRLQKSCKVFDGGEPVSLTGAGGHPPRTFAAGTPGGEAEPSWRIVLSLLALAAPGVAKAVRSQARPSLSRAVSCALADEACGAEGVVLAMPRPFAPVAPALSDPAQNANPGMELYLAEETFGTEEISSYAPITAELAGPPVLTLPARTAAALDLADGGSVNVPLPGGGVLAVLRVSEAMAPDLAVLSRRPGIPALCPGGPIAPFDPATLTKAAAGTDSAGTTDAKETRA